MAVKSFLLTSGDETTFDCYVREFTRPRMRRAIEWVQNSARNWRGSDRGVAQDQYEVDVVFYDRESQINLLADFLNSNSLRESVSLSQFGAPIFSPVLDHSSAILAVLTRLGRRRQVAFASPATALFELDATFRVRQTPSLVSTTASLSTLNVQEGFTADRDFTAGAALSYDQTPAYADPAVDTGLFRGRFRQTLAEARAILKYAVSTARAATITFPTLGGVTYPFGYPAGGLPKNCKLLDVNVSRHNQVFWDLDLTFAEEV